RAWLPRARPRQLGRRHRRGHGRGRCSIARRWLTSARHARTRSESMTNLKDCCVREHETIGDAMRSLERSNTQIVLVVDDSQQLLGTLADGVLRRGLLPRATRQSVLSLYVNRRFVSVSPGVGRTEVIDLMQARSIHQIPIVSPEGRLLGLHLLREL